MASPIAIPYSRQDVSQSDLDAVLKVLQSDFLTQGPAVPLFEERMAAYHEVAHGIAVCNATAALHLACLALDVGSGDRVWTSPISFVASANAAIYCGAEVDFVDIDPVTRNMSVEKLRKKLASAKHKGKLPKVLIPVDFSGLPCDMNAIMALAREYGFRVISDSSHAVGAIYENQRVGNKADITVLSFHPVKIVTTGEGGMCLTQDGDLAERLRLLRSHGITRDPAVLSSDETGGWYYEQIMLGYNYRMPDINAALGTSQLKRLDKNFARREALSRRYDELLADLPIKLPIRLNDRQSSHHLYVIEIDDHTVSRGALYQALRKRGIGVNVHYIPIHLQPFYRDRGFCSGDFPASEAYYGKAVTIPLYPSMSHADQDYVCTAIRDNIISIPSGEA